MQCSQQVSLVASAEAERLHYMVPLDTSREQTNEIAYVTQKDIDTRA